MWAIMKTACNRWILICLLLGGFVASFCSLPDKEFLEYKPPVNHSPVIDPLEDQTALVGDLIGITPTATDPDGDALSFTITGWMTGTTIVALSSDVGARTVTVTASDGISTSSTSFTVSIGNYAWAGIAPTVGFSQPNLAGHSAIYDPVNKRMVVFGGIIQGLGYIYWTESLSLVGEGLEYWWDLNPYSCSTFPSRRSQHSSIRDQLSQRMIVFGGEVYTNPTTSFMNDAWELSFTETTEGRWCPLATGGTKPAPRSSHSGIYDPIGQRMIVFGGTEFTSSTPKCNSGESNCIFGDLWALNLTTLSWQEISPPQPRPSPRKGHAAIYDPVRKQMIVFGGRACPNTTCGETNDVWALDLSSPGNEKWKQIAPEGSSPDPREGATGVYIPGSGKIFFVGGNAGSVKLGEVWFLNLERPTWGRVYPDGEIFPDRTSHTMIYDAYNSRLIVFGGLDTNGQGLSDTWSLK